MISLDEKQAPTKVSYFKTARISEAISAYFLLLPDIIGLMIFVFLPVLGAFYVSLHKWDALSPMEFISIRNYVQVLSDSTWWDSILITLKYSIIYIPLSFAISLMLAIFLNTLGRSAQKGFRTLYFVPYAISPVIASLIFIFMYDKKNGYINHLLSVIGIPPQPWLGSSNQVLFSIALVSIWLIVGYNTVIFFAGIIDIPRSYFEAADIDGANFLQKLFLILLPLLKNTITFILVTTTIASFQVFDQIKIMTVGGPAGASNVSVFYIYRKSFELLSIGYGSAMAFVLFLLIFIFSLLQLKYLSTRDRSKET